MEQISPCRMGAFSCVILSLAAAINHFESSETGMNIPSSKGVHMGKQ